MAQGPWSTRAETQREELAHSLTANDLLLGSAFHLSSGGGQDEGAAYTAWGRVATSGFEATYRLRRKKLRQVFRREGRYLLRSNMTGEDPAALWRHYMQLTEIEQAFKELKHNLAIRPIFHQLEQRIEAHIFVSFIAYCLLVTLKNLARPQAPGLTPRAIVEKFAAIEMVDLHVPTADGRHLVLARHTQPSEDHELLLRQLDLALPKQPAPKLLS